MTLGEGMGVIILGALRDFPEAKLGLEPRSSPAKRWLCLPPCLTQLKGSF